MIFPRGPQLLPQAKKQRFFPRGPLMPLLKNIVGGEHSRADARAHARVLSLMKLYHSPAASQDAGGIIPPHPLARVLHPRAPILFVCSLYKHSCCQGTAPKNCVCGGNTPTPPCEGIIPSRSRVAIRACSSPCAVPRRAARLSRGRSLSRRENAETLVRSAFSMKTIRSLAHFHSV